MVPIATANRTGYYGNTRPQTAQLLSRLQILMTSVSTALYNKSGSQQKSTRHTKTQEKTQSEEKVTITTRLKYDTDVGTKSLGI